VVFTDQRIEARPPEFRISHMQVYCRQRPVRDT
jgi:hypothetical protein